MTTMIEKVAKAIYEAMDLSDSLSLPEAEKYARAAIEAMREPTIEMRASYDDAHRRSRTKSGFSISAYRSMIDAAISEEKAE